MSAPRPDTPLLGKQRWATRLPGDGLRLDLRLLGFGSAAAAPVAPGRWLSLDNGTGVAGGEEDYPVREVLRGEKDDGPFRSYGEVREGERSLVRRSFALAMSFLKRYWGLGVFFLALQVGLVLLAEFAFERLRWEAWVSFVVVTVLLVVLVDNLVPTAAAMCFGVTVLLAFKIITAKEALEGFSNTGMASVAVLFIVADGIERTSVLLPLFRLMLGKPDKLWVAQLRLMVPVAVISVFLHNTPVVAMLIPVVQSWSRRAGFPVSRLMMLLNNATILGGTASLLGTSTNLVVDGLVKESNFLDADGNKVALTVFGIAPVCVILAVLGILYMLVFSRCLLSDRGQADAVSAIIRNPREYTVALLVTGRSPIVGETIQAAGLRHLEGLYLIEMTRADGTVIQAVSPDRTVKAGDTLLFAGVVETVTELYTKIPGLVPATSQSTKMTHERHQRRLVELVISPSSFLRGRSAKETQFRSRFDSVIIAVHRKGEHVKEKIADIALEAGDTLLVETSADFIKHYGRDSNFALVSEVSGSQPPRSDKAHMALSAVILVAMVAAVTADVMDLVSASAIASGLLIATGCMSLSNAAQSVDLSVMLTIAASFGIAKGMEKSGAGDALATFTVDSFRGLGTTGLLFGIYIGTALLSSMLTNTAAVSLCFPIIRTILLKEKGLNPLAALYTLMIGASASFSTPIGYQTNMMVHGPGGYTFMDWVIFGVPLQLVIGIAGVYIINCFYESV